VKEEEKNGAKSIRDTGRQACEGNEAFARSLNLLACQSELAAPSAQAALGEANRIVLLFRPKRQDIVILDRRLVLMHVRRRGQSSLRAPRRERRERRGADDERRQQNQAHHALPEFEFKLNFEFLAITGYGPSNVL
jgi:hypothetical protein